MSFASILESCIEAIERGESVESCLAAYPEHADRLEPLLQITVELRSLPQFKMSHAARARGRELVQQTARRHQSFTTPAHHSSPELRRSELNPFYRNGSSSTHHSSNGRQSSPPLQPSAPQPSSVGPQPTTRSVHWPRRFLVAAACFVLVSSIVLGTASQAVPGDMLYPTKRSAEAAFGVVMNTFGARAVWQMHLVDLRVQELITLENRGHTPDPRLVAEIATLAEEVLNAAQALAPRERERFLAKWLHTLQEYVERSSESSAVVAVLDEQESIAAAVLADIQTEIAMAPTVSAVQTERVPTSVTTAQILAPLPIPSHTPAAVSDDVTVLNHKEPLPTVIATRTRNTPDETAADHPMPSPISSHTPTAIAAEAVYDDETIPDQEEFPPAVNATRTQKPGDRATAAVHLAPIVVAPNSIPSHTPTARLANAIPDDETVLDQDRDPRTPRATETPRGRLITSGQSPQTKVAATPSVRSAGTATVNAAEIDTDVAHAPAGESMVHGTRAPIVTTGSVMAPTSTVAPKVTDTPVWTPTATSLPADSFLPTATKTSTQTRTATPLPTATPIPTVTSTPLLANVPLSLATDTPLPTATLVPTATPSPTATPAPTATNTTVPTATDTPSPTDRPVPTATDTIVPTATATPLPTYTPLPTDTPVPTATDTPSPTDTPLPTATNTTVPTSTATPLPTYTPLPTDTPVPTATNTIIPTDTATPLPTDTPVPTATPLPTDTPVPTMTNTSIPTDTATLLPTYTPLPTDTLVPTATNTTIPTDTATLSPTDTPLPTATNISVPTPTATPEPNNMPVPVAMNRSLRMKASDSTAQDVFATP